MRLRLSGIPRASLAALSIALYVAWFVGLATGIEAQSDESSASPELVALVAPPTSQLGKLAIERDPFSPDDLPLAGDVAVRSSAFDVPDIRDIRDSDFAVAGADRPVRSTYTLKATIIGSNPVAYVESGSGMQIVRVGDAVAGKTIVRIGLGGVDFADGTRLLLSDARPAAPATSRLPRVDLVRELDALRRVLSRERSRGNVPAPAEPVQNTPTPTTPATFPPPGPLPTIVPGFLPVGVSPTSDPNGPTPYPLPPPRPNF